MAEKSAAEQLAVALGAEDSTIIPAIFEALTDEDEARLLLAAAPPATLEELAERTGMEAQEVERRIPPLFEKGLLFKSRRPEGTRYYRVRNLMQMHDATAVALEVPRAVLDLWKEHARSEMAGFVKKIENVLTKPVIRVIPVNESVEPRSQVLAFEDLKELVEGASSLAVTRCSCRAIDGACGLPLEVCIQVNRAADYAIERGTGRPLTKEETLEMLAMCEEKGLVHIADNQRALGLVICNCCGDCCLNWTSLKQGAGGFVAPSRFRATVDAEACDGCGFCLDRCYFDALEMEAGEGGHVLVEEAKCMGCGLCKLVCPTDAIGLQAVRPEDFVPAA